MTASRSPHRDCLDCLETRPFPLLAVRARPVFNRPALSRHENGRSCYNRLFRSTGMLLVLHSALLAATSEVLPH